MNEDRVPEKRGLTCPKCNPELDDPDIISGYKDSLKYLIFDHFKCKNCGTTLVDIGEITTGEAVNNG